MVEHLESRTAAHARSRVLSHASLRYPPDAPPKTETKLSVVDANYPASLPQQMSQSSPPPPSAAADPTRGKMQAQYVLPDPPGNYTGAPVPMPWDPAASSRTTRPVSVIYRRERLALPMHSLSYAEAPSRGIAVEASSLSPESAVVTTPGVVTTGTRGDRKFLDI